MSRRPVVREAVAAAKSAHHFFCGDGIHIRARLEYVHTEDGRYILVGGDVERLQDCIDEGLGRIIVAHDLYNCCPVGMAQNTVDKIEFHLQCALRFLDHQRERLVELKSLTTAGAVH